MPSSQASAPAEPSAAVDASLSPHAAPASASAAGAGAPSAPGTASVGVGPLAPDFTATAQDGTALHLAALRGKPVVLYFYPKDETPGCTKEACSFRDTWQALARTGAVLVGISADTLDAHRAFVAHYHLPFRLISDPDGAIAALYGVPFERVHRRQTMIIGADGVLRQAFRTVDVSVHAAQVLQAVESLSP
jgi:peroxiredoxin Q/BCP